MTGAREPRRVTAVDGPQLREVLRRLQEDGDFLNAVLVSPVTRCATTSSRTTLYRHWGGATGRCSD